MVKYLLPMLFSFSAFAQSVSISDRFKANTDGTAATPAYQFKTSSLGFYRVDGTNIGTAGTLNLPDGGRVNTPPTTISGTGIVTGSVVAAGDSNKAGFLAVSTGSNAIFAGVGYNNNTVRFRGYRASGGDSASPAALTGAGGIAQIEAFGYDGTSFTNGAGVFLRSTGTWSGSDHRTNIQLLNTLQGTTTLVTSLQVGDLGDVTIGPSGSTVIHPVNGSMNLTGTISAVGGTMTGAFNIFQNAGVPFRIGRDTNAGDSTNTVSMAIGNSGSGQGDLRMQYTNAAATGQPRGTLSFQPRNNADSAAVNSANIYMQKDSGADTATITLAGNKTRITSDAAGSSEIVNFQSTSVNFLTGITATTISAGGGTMTGKLAVINGLNGGLEVSTPDASAGFLVSRTGTSSGSFYIGAAGDRDGANTFDEIQFRKGVGTSVAFNMRATDAGVQTLFWGSGSDASIARTGSGALNSNASITATSFIGPLTGAASSNILKTGDTMTGNFAVEGAGNTVNLKIYTTNNVLNDKASLTFGTNPGDRAKARISMVNSTTGNSKGDLIFETNNGSSLNEVLKIDGDGVITQTSGSSPWVRKTGDTMTGDLFIRTASNATSLRVEGDANAGDSTNILSVKIGNYGTSQGSGFVQWINAAATGSPTFRMSFQPRTNDNTSQINSANIIIQKISGSDNARITLGADSTRITSDASGATPIATFTTAGMVMNVAGGSIQAGTASSTSGSLVSCTSAGANCLSMSMAASTEARLVAQGASNMTFYTNGNEQVKITSAGQLQAEASIASTSNTTGGLVVTGGMGIAGAIVQGTVTSISANASNTNGVTPINVLGGTTVAEVSQGMQISDGTNNRRIKLFLNQTAGQWGLWANYSSGAPTFVFGIGSSEIYRVEAAGMRIGVTGVINTTNEQLTVRLTDTTGGSSSNAAISSELRSNTNTAITTSGAYTADYSNLTRITTANTTDTSGTMSSYRAGVTFTPSTATTYTNNSSNGISAIRISGPSNTGVGSVAITQYQGLLIENQGLAGVTTSAGLRIANQSGSVNNYSIQTGTGLVSLGGALALTKTDVASAATITAMSCTSGFVRITGSTATSLQGIAAGIDGQICKIFVDAANVTFANENAGASAANRLLTNTGADVTTTGRGAAEFMYETGNARWIMMSVLQ